MEAWKEIDGLPSVEAMRVGLAGLPPEALAEIIRAALAESRFQFTWSCLAALFDIPASSWPPKPEGCGWRVQGMLTITKAGSEDGS